MNHDSLSVAEVVRLITKISEHRYDEKTISNALIACKKKAVKDGRDDLAASLWCLQQAVFVQSKYIYAFSLLKQSSFYEAWCELEEVEQGLLAIKPPQKYLPDYWRELWITGKLEFIEKQVSKWQKLFPYKIFASTGMTYKEYCSICNVEINPRKPCEHKDGRIYAGEMRTRVLRDIRCDHIALVENPAHKFCVVFLADPDTGERIDQYDYNLVARLISALSDPFQEWSFVLQHIERDHIYFESKGISKTDLCPCGSGKVYEKCCYESTIAIPFYEFTFAPFL